MTDSNVDGKHDNVSSSTKKDELRLEDTAELSENSNGVTSCKTPSPSKRKFPAWMLSANSSSSDKQNLENNDEGGLSKRPKPGESSTSDKAQENGEDTNVSDGTTSSSVAISTASNIKIEPVEENDAPSTLSTNDSNVLTNGTTSTVVKNERNETDDTAASTSTGTQDIKDIKPAIKVEKADASSTSRECCKYGIRCYRRNPMHRIEEAHPGDHDYKRPQYPLPPLGTPACSFGNLCYRRNPIHFQLYSHPPDTDFQKNYLLRKRRKRQQQQQSGNNDDSSDLDEYDSDDPFKDDSDLDYVPSDDDIENTEELDYDDCDKAEE